MKIFTFFILIILSSLATAQDQAPQNEKLLAKHTPEYFCQLDAQLINAYGAAYLKTTGNNRPGICADLALDITRQRNIMKDDVGLAVLPCVRIIWFTSKASVNLRCRVCV